MRWRACTGKKTRRCAESEEGRPSTPARPSAVGCRPRAQSIGATLARLPSGHPGRRILAELGRLDHEMVHSGAIRTSERRPWRFEAQAGLPRKMFHDLFNDVRRSEVDDRDQAPPARGEPARSCRLRSYLGRGLSFLDLIGQHRPHESDRSVSIPARVQVLHVCHLVGASGHHAPITAGRFGCRCT